jgi:putative endonuclease
MKTYFVYILTNVSRSSLYTGITSRLGTRGAQHKFKVNQGFTSRYNVDRLVYFEEFHRVTNAIAREKQLKGWRRSEKVALIELMNPRWDDLFDHLPKPRSFDSLAPASGTALAQDDASKRESSCK